MIPLRDENPTRYKSITTFLIIGINLVTWIFVQGIGFDPDLVKSVFKFGVIPGDLLGNIEPGTRITIGNGITVIFDDTRNWYTVVTSMFMHGGWFHLIGNMWFLAIFGDNVEDAMGPFKFFLFYILCGVAATAAQVFTNPTGTVPMVGASGAIGGIMGAYAVLYPRAPVHLLVFFGIFFTRIIVPAYIMLGYWFLLQFMGIYFSPDKGSQGGVAFWAHIGGFAAGIVLLLFFCNSRRVEECRNKRGKTFKFIQRHK